MGTTEGHDAWVSERRGFVQRRREHDAVVGVDFTRDGVRTVFVEVIPGDAFDERVRREAERVGYDIEAPGTDARQRWRLPEWWAGSPEAVRVLRFDADRHASTGGSVAGSNGA